MKTVGSFIANVNVDDLTERISVIYFDTERNERGDIISTQEIERCRVWAKILPLTARISDDTPERVNAISYRVTIRYRNDIKPDDEIIWRERRLRLKSPPYSLDGKKIFTAMDCEEVIEDDTT